MPDWVLVNGARVERAYFEENLREARAQEWALPTERTRTGHRHCIICGVAIETELSSGYMTSKVGLLCASCHGQFIVG
jgi:hypothetical protein